MAAGKGGSGRTLFGFPIGGKAPAVPPAKRRKPAARRKAATSGPAGWEDAYDEVNRRAGRRR
jgi:hypothetical protein